MLTLAWNHLAMVSYLNLVAFLVAFKGNLNKPYLLINPLTARYKTKAGEKYFFFKKEPIKNYAFALCCQKG